MQNSTRLDCSLIRIDGGTQTRAYIHNDTILDYAQLMKDGVVFPPVVVFYDGTDYWLADGFHRFHAAREIDRKEIEAEIKQGTRRDAVLYSVGANNTHGVRRTNDDKGRAVETLLHDSEWAAWSDREIARRCGVSNRFVTNVRANMQKPLSVNGSQIVDAPRMVQRNGTIYTMDTSHIGTPVLTPLPHIDDEDAEHDNVLDFVVEDDDKHQHVDESTPIVPSRSPLGTPDLCGSCGTNRGNIGGDVDDATHEMYGYVCTRCFRVIRDNQRDVKRLSKVLAYLQQTRL